jgi:hypothetical protein
MTETRDMMFSTLVALARCPRPLREGRTGPPFEMLLDAPEERALPLPDIADHHYDFFHSGGRAVQPLRARAAREVLHDADVFKSRLTLFRGALADGQV